MKTVFALLALIIGAPIAYLTANHWDYGASIPPGLPADIPIVEGEVIAGKRTLFEDGKGYVLSIQSERAYPDVVQFYQDHYNNGRITPAPGMGKSFSTADFSVGDKRVLLEIHTRETQTQVTMAVHLGRWW